MKRLLSALLTLILISALCVSALAEQYTHPVAGYCFTLPEGWFAVDSDNAEDIIARSSGNAELSDSIRSGIAQAGSMPVVILYEINRVSPLFGNNMNVLPIDLGEEADISEILPYAETFEAGVRELYSDYEPIASLTIIEELGPWNAAIMGGKLEIKGNAMQYWSIRIISGTVLYEFTLMSLAEYAENHLEMMGYMVASFVAP